ncbi:MAG: SpoIIE family protein phosphatase [Candidatus Fimenecus sp.]
MTSFETAEKTYAEANTDGQAFLPEGVRRVLRQMLSFLGGLLLSSLQLTAGISPFGVCFLAAVPTRYIFAVGTGAAAGYLLTLDSVSALRNVAALISVAVLSRLMCEFERVRRIRLLPSCIAAAVILLTGTAVLAADGFALSSAAMLLGETALSFVLTYFFAQALDAVHGLLSSDKPTLQTLPGVCITVFLLLASVSDIAILHISPARIAAVYILFVISRLYCEAGGAIAGLAAAGAFLLDASVGAGAAGFAAAGFAAGIFAHSKRGFGVGFALAAFGAVLLFTGADISAVYLFVEAVVGAVLFLCTPKKWRQKAYQLTARRQSAHTPNPQRQAFLTRLGDATAAVETLSQTVQKASKLLDTAVPVQSQARFARAKEAVCDNCGRYTYCWEQHRRDTLQAFAQMDAPLRESKPLCAENIPASMQARCIRLTALTDSLQRFSVRDAEHSAAQAKIRELRQANAERFDGVIDMLEALSTEMSEDLSFDEAAADRAGEALKNTFGTPVQSVTCAYTAGGTLRLELIFPQATELPPQADLRETLETVTGRRLELPVVQNGAAGVQAVFCERTAFRVEAAAAKITADRETHSGDSYESFYDGRGGYFVILSDGMGQGTRAALDSTLAVQMTATLLKAGIDVHSALKMVNASLMLKSDAESLATLDILHVDLYTSEAGFYKAGAAKSLLRRKDKCMEIKRAALPVGILREVRFGCCTGKLLPGDLVVMASDGAFDYAEQPFKKAVGSIKLQNDCAEIAKQLAETAKKQTAAPRSDDITVIALKLRNNTE